MISTFYKLWRAKFIIPAILFFCHESEDSSLHKKTVSSSVTWKIEILASSSFHTSDFFILLDLTNLFQHPLLVSIWSTNLKAFPCFKHGLLLFATSVAPSKRVSSRNRYQESKPNKNPHNRSKSSGADPKNKWQPTPQDTQPIKPTAKQGRPPTKKK